MVVKKTNFFFSIVTGSQSRNILLVLSSVRSNPNTLYSHGNTHLQKCASLVLQPDSRTCSPTNCILQNKKPRCQRILDVAGLRFNPPSGRPYQHPLALPSSPSFLQLSHCFAATDAPFKFN